MAKLAVLGCGQKCIYCMISYLMWAHKCHPHAVDVLAYTYRLIRIINLSKLPQGSFQPNSPGAEVWLSSLRFSFKLAQRIIFERNGCVPSEKFKFHSIVQVQKLPNSTALHWKNPK